MLRRVFLLWVLISCLGTSAWAQPDTLTQPYLVYAKYGRVEKAVFPVHSRVRYWQRRKLFRRTDFIVDVTADSVYFTEAVVALQDLKIVAHYSDVQQSQQEQAFWLWLLSMPVSIGSNYLAITTHSYALSTVSSVVSAVAGYSSLPLLISYFLISKKHRVKRRGASFMQGPLNVARPR